MAAVTLHSTAGNMKRLPSPPHTTILPSLTSSLKPELSMTNILVTSATVANGMPPQARSSPAPQMPNGKPTSPYAQQGNPMNSPMNQQMNQQTPQTVSSKDPKAAAQAASDMRNVVRRKLTGYVGFANLPNQWHRKSVRKGFNFNVMVVGKSTFVRELSCY